jgi:signal transduction histidine kinase
MTRVATVRDADEWRGGIDGRLRWLPYLTLAGSAILVTVAGDTVPAGAPLGVTFVVVALTAGWMLWFVTLHPQWGHRRRLMAGFFVGLVLLLVALVVCSPLFGFFAWTGYLFVLQALRGRWITVGATVVAAVTAISQIGGFPTLRHLGAWPVFGVVALFNIGVATAMTFMASASNAQADRRQQMITQLAEANAKLATAMRENAGLHAQLLTQAREAGVLDERQRLAGEIHDILAQGLTGIVTQLEAADQAAGRPADWRRHLGQAKQLARDSLTEARRSVQAMSPRPLVEAGLPDALADVVDGWSTMNGVTAELITTGTAQRLLPEIETTLLRTAQEALANVARHADATRVALTLSYMEDLVTLDVRDDGLGFDPAAPRVAHSDGGFGLAAMRERVHRIAGTLEVESEPGSGTAISACVPAISLREAAA